MLAPSPRSTREKRMKLFHDEMLLLHSLESINRGQAPSGFLNVFLLRQFLYATPEGYELGLTDDGLERIESLRKKRDAPEQQDGVKPVNQSLAT